MKFLLKSAVILVASVFIMSSCKSTKNIEKEQLTGYWVLKTMEGKPAMDDFKGSLPALEFDFENNMISGTGGCNRLTGGFTLNEKNELNVKAASTMMMCIHQNAEPQFLKILGTPDLLLEVEKNGLLKMSKDGKTLVEFEKGEKLESTKGVSTVTEESLSGIWILKTMGSEDVEKLFNGKNPTITFNSEGGINGNAGCNNYRSKYTLSENTLTFGPIMSTKMACPSLDGESKFTKILDEPCQAAINGSTLTFLKGGNIVMTFEKSE